MAERFLTGADAEVAAWLFEQVGCEPIPFDAAVGVTDAAGALKGGFVFTGWDGEGLEAHFWGPRVLTKTVVRRIFAEALDRFNALHVVVKASKAHMARGVQKLGAQLVMHNSEFGEFVFDRAAIVRLAGLKEK